jgi:hypothetical protein
VSRLNADQVRFYSGGDLSSKVFLEHYTREFESKIDIFFVGFLRIKWRFLNRLFVLYNVLLGRLNGLTKYKVKKFKNLIDSGVYDCVIFDSSLYGSLVEYANVRGLRTVVIYQNLEIDYFTGQYFLNHWLDFVILKQVFFCERRSIRFANENLFLTDYDRSRALRLFSVKGEVKTTKILVQSLIQNNIIDYELFEKDETGYYYVGSDNSQNRHALEIVLSCIGLKPLYVFGSVCKSFNNRSNIFENVFFEGEVIDLNSRVKGLTLLAPLYFGSGIKLKIIEAIANGNQVLTSVEGVSGLEFALKSGVLVLNEFSAEKTEIPNPNWAQFYYDLKSYLKE